MNLTFTWVETRDARFWWVKGIRLDTGRHLFTWRWSSTLIPSLYED
jgi:hypothetical protein